MIKQFTLAAAAATVIFASAPAYAATVVGDGAVVVLPAGPGAFSAPINFAVSGTAGNFTATFTFLNPFDPAAATGSASFTFDPDQLVFTGGTFGPGSDFAIGSPTSPAGSAITVSLGNLAFGAQTLTLMGTFSPTGNGTAVVGGSLNLTESAVPEPATWAMFILGFGVLGAGLRRRNAQVTSAKAALNFA